jgi:hypothetical protein
MSGARADDAGTNRRSEGGVLSLRSIRRSQSCSVQFTDEPARQFNRSDDHEERGRALEVLARERARWQRLRRTGREAA